MNRKYTLEIFAEKANKIHNNKFKYISFESVSKLVEIECPVHGTFLQQGHSHLSGVGCAKCSGKHKPTTEEFIEKAVKVHGDKYDYSSVKYINAKTPVEIICKEHGTFQQNPDKHINAKHGCPKCCKQGIKLTQDDYLTKAKNVHGDKYEYTGEYINIDTPIEICCKIHGAFLQTPHNHIHDRNGCPKCARGIIPQDIFIEQIITIHGDKFNFPDEYNGINTKINFECKKHGLFLQTPRGILGGVGCPDCKLDKFLENFIKRGKEIHENKYDYSLITEYKDRLTKMPIICPYHGVYYRNVEDHIYCERGCEICVETRGEKEIRIFLEKNNINYIPQHKFDGCRGIKNNKTLEFDFYLPELNLCIEYNGIQHYEYTEYFHKTPENFEYRKTLDQIKIDYCKNNNISLLIIRYDEEILSVLKEQLLKLNIPS